METKPEMTANDKYMFDTEFDAGGNVVKERPPKPKTRFSVEDVEEIRTQSFEEGLRQGQASVEAQTAQAAAEQIKQISEILGKLLPTLTHECEQARADAAALAFTSAQSLAAALIDREPETEIRQLIDSCLSDLRTEPYIKIEVGESMLSQIERYMAEVTASTGLDGRVSVIGKPDLPGTDCRIEWKGGGLERNFTAQAETVREKVKAYLQSTSSTQLTLFSE